MTEVLLSYCESLRECVCVFFFMWVVAFVHCVTFYRHCKSPAALLFDHRFGSGVVFSGFRLL